MSRLSRLDPEFVVEIPRELAPAKLYISIAYATATHLCCCGCGNEVVTPLHPTRWRLTFDGESVSLNPSVGSWSLPCQSHYFIKNNHVRWAAHWSRDEIYAARARDQLATGDYFSRGEDHVAGQAPMHMDSGPNGKVRRLWRRLVAK